MDTIQEMFFQVKEKAESIGLKETDIVLDHTIYSKASDVSADLKNVELNNYINLRMGGHVYSLSFSKGLVQLASVTKL